MKWNEKVWHNISEICSLQSLPGKPQISCKWLCSYRSFVFHQIDAGNNKNNRIRETTCTIYTECQISVLFRVWFSSLPPPWGLFSTYCKMFKLTAWECLVSVVTGNDCWYFAMTCLTCKGLKFSLEFYFYLLLTHDREAALLASGICLFLVSVLWVPSACSFSLLKWWL